MDNSITNLSEERFEREAQPVYTSIGSFVGTERDKAKAARVKRMYELAVELEVKSVAVKDCGHDSLDDKRQRHAHVWVDLSTTAAVMKNAGADEWKELTALADTISLIAEPGRDIIHVVFTVYDIWC